MGEGPTLVSEIRFQVRIRFIRKPSYPRPGNMPYPDPPHSRACHQQGDSHATCPTATPATSLPPLRATSYCDRHPLQRTRTNLHTQRLTVALGQHSITHTFLHMPTRHFHGKLPTVALLPLTTQTIAFSCRSYNRTVVPPDVCDNEYRDRID